VLRRLTIVAVLGLGACVAPREAAPPPPAPAPRPVASAPVAPPVDWSDRPYTLGDWSYSGGQASYGLAGTPRLTLACEAGQIRLGLPGAPAGAVTVRTTYGDVVRQAQAGAQLTLAARDPLLDQMAYSRGRFMLSAGGQDVIVPAWPEVARVLEDCRG
jgi:hypothetical protein